MAETNPDRTARMREYRRKWAEKNPDYQRQWREKNRQKLRAQQQKNYQANPAAVAERIQRWRDKNPGYARYWHLLRRHGLDAAAFMAMWESQERCCYLCRRELDLDAAFVEHWHGCPAHDPKTSCRFCWRGLAHHACNIIAGTACDDSDLLRAIADNLEAANADVMERQRGAPQPITLF